MLMYYSVMLWETLTGQSLFLSASPAIWWKHLALSSNKVTQSTCQHLWSSISHMLYLVSLSRTINEAVKGQVVSGGVRPEVSKYFHVLDPQVDSLFGYLSKRFCQLFSSFGQFDKSHFPLKIPFFSSSKKFQEYGHELEHFRKLWTIKF